MAAEQSIAAKSAAKPSTSTTPMTSANGNNSPGVLVSADNATKATKTKANKAIHSKKNLATNGASSKQNRVSGVNAKNNNSNVNPRYKAGRATGGETLQVVTNGDRLFRGTERNAAKIPAQIADRMRGKEFRNFDHFRQTFWKEVANDPVLSKKFSVTDLSRMRNGKSPIVAPSQSTGQSTQYVLHHATPINQGGAVYDFDNLVILTPAQHKVILDPKYHYGK